MSKVFLRVKIKSLAAEARIIRQEEGRFRDLWHHQQTGPFLGLKLHRTQDVRKEARSALLAYGFLRGVPYSKIEAKCWEAPDWFRIMQIVTKFGETQIRRQHNSDNGLPGWPLGTSTLDKQKQMEALVAWSKGELNPVWSVPAKAA